MGTIDQGKTGIAYARHTSIRNNQDCPRARVFKQLVDSSFLVVVEVGDDTAMDSDAEGVSQLTRATRVLSRDNVSIFECIDKSWCRISKIPQRCCCQYHSRAWQRGGRRGGGWFGVGARLRIVDMTSRLVWWGCSGGAPPPGARGAPEL